MSARRVSRPMGFLRRLQGHDQRSESAIHRGETALLSRSRQRPPEVLQHLVTPARFDPLRRVA